VRAVVTDRPAVASEAHQRVAVQGEVVSSPKTAWLSRPALGALTALALAFATELVPQLKVLHVFAPPPGARAMAVREIPPPNMKVGEARLSTETRDRPELEQPDQIELPTGAAGPIATARSDHYKLPSIDKPPVPIENPNGHALDGFYASLYRTALKQPGAITRVIHFGDSVVTSDYVSGTLRRKLQAQFGDAGHGFMLIANAWPAYFHNDVYRFASRGWFVSRIVGPLAADGLYGLGGVSFRAPPGARARFGTARHGEYGRKVSRFIVDYLEQPGGGLFEVNVDGKHYGEIDTSGPEKKAAYYEVHVPDGAHMMELVTRGKGFSRAFGVVMERDVPGVVLDAVGVQGARIRFLDKENDAHWARQLQWRHPNLMIYEFGANESADGFAYPMKEFKRTMEDVLRQGRQAVPEAGCLVLAAMDRAEKRGDDLVTLPVIPVLVKMQHEAADDVGCAFFNTYEAMGGRGSMAAWVRRGLGQADLTHPTGVGSEVLGTWVYRALMQGYGAYVKQHAK
jgi:hypothetical protein